MIERRQHGQALDCINGGYGGYQARCWYCDWRGPVRPPDRDGKREARADYALHDFAEERDVGPWERVVA
jgi:hypothetical protein